ncbi:MAG: very short patch repair endonuclease, partial [Prevotellaceae bacterium]|nr:very short patch repair endonuclease [Prevotellaceae bacterium]
TSLQRHNNMAAIRDKDTKPEMVVRRFLWSRGFRYRLNHPRLPGKPDIVLKKYRTCIFVNGCFWHGHNVDMAIENPLLAVNSECCKIPHTNRKFWVEKICRNQKRDADVQQRLAAMGWNSITIWECDLRPNRREQVLESLAFTLERTFLRIHKPKTYRIPDEDEYSIAAEDRVGD